MKFPVASSVLSAAALLFTMGASSLADAAAASAVQVNYTDPYDGASLSGYLVSPPPGTEDPKGLVVVIPDWDGVNEYEIERATMLAEGMGYVAFAADIYGSENYQPESTEEKRAMAGKYRSNLTLSNSRIKLAIDQVKKGAPLGAGVAIMGYCFGGSIALNHALSGADDAIATIAYHGSISAVTKDFNKTVNTKVVIYSGGEDTQDSTASVVEMEEALNIGENVWEISRYSGVGHGFTNFGGGAYNEYVDGRTWESTERFLQEVFEDVPLKADIPGKIIGEEVNYVDPVDGTDLVGFRSIPSGPSINSSDKVPAVVIIHDANGIDDYEKTRAQMLADLGYVGFAADIYGSDHGYDMSNRTERSALLNKIRDDVPFFVQRIKAGIAAVKAHPKVDPGKIALIGYCFGGTGVIDYGVMGESEAKAVVSFHGGLSKVPMAGEKTIRVKMNIQSGGDDDASSSIEMLENAMERGNATWEYARYSDVLHSFTNWNATRNRYNARADVRSWESMKSFLSQAFAEETSIATTAAPPGEETSIATTAAPPGDETTIATTAASPADETTIATTAAPPADETTIATTAAPPADEITTVAPLGSDISGAVNSRVQAFSFCTSVATIVATFGLSYLFFV